MAKRKSMKKEKKIKEEKEILYGRKKIRGIFKPNDVLDLMFEFIYGDKPKDKRFAWGLEKVKIRPFKKKTYEKPKEN